MNGQLSCEGPLGKTTLFEDTPGPGAHMRPESELKPPVEDEGYLSPTDLKEHMYY